MHVNKIGIKCKDCMKEWRLEIPIQNIPIEAFATICACGNLIVGNCKNAFDIDLNNLEESIKVKYLTNGAYSIISVDPKIIDAMDLLELE